MRQCLDVMLRDPPQVERYADMLVLVAPLGGLTVRAHLRPHQAAALGRALLREFESVLEDAGRVTPLRAKD